MKQNDLHNYFSYYAPYEAQNVLQRKLEKEYLARSASTHDALQWSYRNTPAFHYEWLLGRTYWTEGAQSSLLTRPLLLFYGLTHLLKGILLTEDPHYPAAADMLAHGVTTRKKKRKQFTFMEDEVKIQKQGFFPHFSSRMFHVKHSAGEKWKINHLFFKWDTMVHLYLDVYGEKALPRVQPACANLTVEHVSPAKEQSISLIQKQLEQLGIEVEGIKKRTADSVLFSIKRLPDNVHSQLVQRGSNYYMPPSLLDTAKMAPLCVHYLLLYELSMLCRYEGEWWGDLCTQRQGEDYAFIHFYLEWVLAEVPRQFTGFFSSGESLQ
ncbi:YaaC family protein [Salibacterium qingdaonense]|uniref:YaaC-like Protein n=1 Tax=Salibacterium qingdaonense TaxID=266892 RepID=A0A1I4NA48_9BACI|nr:YaaC family protein [Salibacterium qingdaonense]SFM12255.1 YaaC-like Protein [Salibacterium qingdaonense]